MPDRGRIGNAGACGAFHILNPVRAPPMRRIIIGVLGICLSATICLGGGWTSWSMFSEANFRPQIDENDLRTIVKALELSDEERSMVQDLHTAHIGRVRDEGAQVKADCLDLIERSQMLGDGTDLKEVIKARDEWSKRREALDKEFLVDLRLVLSAEQDARWSIVERELRRLRAIPNGRMLGESIDAIAFVSDDVETPTPEITAILDRYARDVDVALRARDETLADAKEDNLPSLITTDPEAVRRIYEKARADRIRVRDLNRKAVEEVAARLEPEAGARLRKRLIDTTTENLNLTNSFAMQVLTAAADMESLTESQRSRIDAATKAYIAKRDEWIVSYLRTAMEIEESVIPDQIEKALRGETPTETRFSMTESVSERTRLVPLRKAWEQRIVFEQQTRREALAMLTPQQRIELPLLIKQVAIQFGDLYGTDGSVNP